MRPVASLMLALGLGCSVEPCDPGQEVDQLGFCVPAAVPEAGGADAGPGTGDAGDASGGAAGSATCEDPAEFGDECADSSECHCLVDYCALQPGAATGVCTRTGCVDDPSICAETWQCLDLSAFSPDLPASCVPPA